jgi:Mg/Co/Ni transporter MgtE
VLPVVDESSRHVGVVTYAAVVAAYERAAAERAASIADADARHTQA